MTLQEYHAQLEEMRVSIRQLEENLSAARRRSDLYESELKESRQTSEELKRKAVEYQQKIQKVCSSSKQEFFSWCTLDEVWAAVYVFIFFRLKNKAKLRWRTFWPNCRRYIQYDNNSLFLFAFCRQTFLRKKQHIWYYLNQQYLHGKLIYSKVPYKSTSTNQNKPENHAVFHQIANVAVFVQYLSFFICKCLRPMQSNKSRSKNSRRSLPR